MQTSHSLAEYPTLSDQNLTCKELNFLSGKHLKNGKLLNSRRLTSQALALLICGKLLFLSQVYTLYCLEWWSTVFWEGWFKVNIVTSRDDDNVFCLTHIELKLPCSQTSFFESVFVLIHIVILIPPRSHKMRLWQLEYFSTLKLDPL